MLHQKEKMMYKTTRWDSRKKEDHAVITFDCCWVIVKNETDGKHVVLCDPAQNAIFVFDTDELAWEYIGCYSPDSDGSLPKRITWMTLINYCLDTNVAFDKAIINPSPT